MRPFGSGSSTAAEAPGLTSVQVFVIALAAGAAMANNYTLQPLLPEVAQSFGSTIGASGMVAASTQAGYTLGLLLLTPLGDQYDRVSLVFYQFLGLAAALLAAAGASRMFMLIGAGIAAGAMITIVVHLNALAAHLAPPHRRGRVVGTVGTGVALGILSGRIAGGVIGQHLGWRAMLAVSAGLALLLAALIRGVLPADGRKIRLRYRELLSSLAPLFRSHRLLREGAAVGGCWFAAFSAFWASLAAHVAEPPFHYGPEAAGLFGLVGIAGALASRAAGSWSDRIGPRRVIALGVVCVLAAFLLMWRFGDTLWGMILGVILVDLGCFAALVANQTRVLAIDPEARSRIYSIYMFLYYAAGAAGSLLGPILLSHAGWWAVCAFGALLAVAGLGAIGHGATLENARRRQSLEAVIPRQCRDGEDDMSTDEIRPGLRGTTNVTVTSSLTVPAVSAAFTGFADMPPVLATAFLVGLVEWACVEVLKPFLKPAEATVGTHVDLSHRAPTTIGMAVVAEVELTEVRGHDLRFRVCCRDDAGIIGEGTHRRAIIVREKFLAHAEARRPVS